MKEGTEWINILWRWIRGLRARAVSCLTEKGKICSVAQREFTADFSEAGMGRARSAWTSGPHSSEWQRRPWEKSARVPANIAAIGITNQRETTIVWDKRDGASRSAMPLSGSAARTSQMIR